jgi:putative membrane protein
MNRRLVTAGLFAALAIPALAQQSAPVSPIPVTPVPAEAQPQGGVDSSEAARSNEERIRRTQQGGAPQDTTTQRRQGAAAGQQAAPQSAPASPADTQHIQETLASATVTLQAATFAESKAQHPRVRRFAAFERAEQDIMLEVLRSMAEPATTASTNIQAAQATSQNAPQTPSQAAATAPVIPPDQADALERMSRAAAGPDFDRAFVAFQLDRHRNFLQVQERYLAAQSQNREQVNIARLARAWIREHIAELESLQVELRP